MADRTVKKRKKPSRIMVMALCFTVAFTALIFRVGWLQIVRGKDLSREALDQQTSDNTVSAKRGNIYDRNYKVLATNSTVETISITRKR